MSTAFITGASRGIGRSIALALAENGWDIGILATSRDRLEKVAGEARSIGGGRVALAQCDVRQYDQVEEAVESLVGELGAPCLLVNNAGRIDTEVPVWQAVPEELAAVVETNVLGTLYLERAVIPHMLTDGGRVVNLVSGAGANSWGLATAYTASKAAQLRNVGDVTAAGAESGILAFGVAPGVVRTDMVAGMELHANRTEFTPVEATTELVDAIGKGLLDAWAGRYLRAGTDTAESLIAAEAALEGAPAAREFVVLPWGETDPLT